MGNAVLWHCNRTTCLCLAGLALHQRSTAYLGKTDFARILNEAERLGYFSFRYLLWITAHLEHQVQREKAKHTINTNHYTHKPCGLCFSLPKAQDSTSLLTQCSKWAENHSSLHKVHWAPSIDSCRHGIIIWHVVGRLHDVDSRHSWFKHFFFNTNAWPNNNSGHNTELGQHLWTVLNTGKLRPVHNTMQYPCFASNSWIYKNIALLAKILWSQAWTQCKDRIQVYSSVLLHCVKRWRTGDAMQCKVLRCIVNRPLVVQTPPTSTPKMSLSGTDIWGKGIFYYSVWISSIFIH